MWEIGLMKRISHKKNRAHGFTLIEIMVVMVIISVMIVGVSVTLRRDYQDLVNEEMKRFQTVVSLARDEAVFQARSLAVGFEKDSYVFMAIADNASKQKWQPLKNAQLSQYKLPKNLEIDVLRDGLPIKLMEKKTDKPQVFLFSTGEVTPFEIGITYPARAFIRVTFDGLGRVKKLNEDE
jgi:general secretion pathway protein H